MESSGETKLTRPVIGIIVAVVVTCAVAAIVIPTSIVLVNNKKANDEWERYKLKFYKNYTSEEEETRKENWLVNRKEVLRHNRRYKAGKESYERVLTSVADMSDAEFEEYIEERICGKTKLNVTGIPIKRMHKRAADAAVAESVDWTKLGAVTKIKNQGECGSCWAFATVASVESYAYIKSGLRTLSEYSEQYLLDCDSTSSDDVCEGGNRYYAAKYVQTNGIPYSHDYRGYQARKIACDAAPPKQTIGYSSVKLLADEDQMMREIAENGPISCGVRLSVEMQNYLEGSSAGTFRPPDGCPASLGYHAMVIVGYGTDENGMAFWLIKNSWGEGTGLNGYVRLQRGKNACGIADVPLTLYG